MFVGGLAAIDKVAPTTVEELAEELDVEVENARLYLEHLRQEDYLSQHSIDGERHYVTTDKFERVFDDKNSDEFDRLEGVAHKHLRADNASGYEALDTFDPYSFNVKGRLRGVSMPRVDTAYGDQQKYREVDYVIYECEWCHAGSVFYLFVDPTSPFDISADMEVEQSVGSLDADDLDDYRRPDMPNKEICEMFGMEYDDSQDAWSSLKEQVANENIMVCKPSHSVQPSKADTVLDEVPQPKLVSDYLTKNYHIDSELRYVFRAQLINFHDNNRSRKGVDYTDVMEVNPHTVIISNTKTGKSKTADNIGRLVNDASDSGLLGFSSSDEANAGSLDKNTGLVALDEVEKTDGSFVSRLNDFMSRGKVITDKGKAPVETKGCPTLMVFANPYIQEDGVVEAPSDVTDYGDSDEEERLRSFDEFLHAVSSASGFGMLGRRLGIIVFGTEFDTAEREETNTLSSDEMDKNEMIVESMLSQTRGEVADLFSHPEVREWVRQRMPDYKESIDKNLNEKDIMLSPVREFWSKNSEAYERIRGFALKHSILDHIGEIWKDDSFDPDRYVDSVLDNAEEHLTRAKNINLRTLQRIGEVDRTRRDIVHNRYTSLEGRYQAVTVAVCKHIQDSAQVEMVDERVPMSELADAYESVDGDTKPDGIEWSDTVSQLRSESHHNELENAVGIRLYRDNEGMSVSLATDDVLKAGSAILGSETDDTQDDDNLNLRGVVKDTIDEDGPVDIEDLVSEYGGRAEQVVEDLIDEGVIYEESPGRVDIL